MPRATEPGSSVCLLGTGASVPGGGSRAGGRSPRAGAGRAAAMAEGQDLFDAIVMADDRFRGEGYQEGYEEGSGLGIIEGRQHGTVYGAKIGSEIGCYQGFAFAWRYLLHSCATEKDRCGHPRSHGQVSIAGGQRRAWLHFAARPPVLGAWPVSLVEAHPDGFPLLSGGTQKSTCSFPPPCTPSHRLTLVF
ncbi:protein LTO1 homolog isoform X1 [Pipistrellus kuhlii]|uniref:protein LTO1 homolog isoform X1 n=1 Tax=Pipistrellus kuhlii TaxID=59472 RepID=UPI001E274390|nr:protein LTO1 homolog isoform X1 [Pipistrellus kuhlii]